MWQGNAGQLGARRPYKTMGSSPIQSTILNGGGNCFLKLRGKLQPTQKNRRDKK
jgi:hypothetical protein